MSGSSDLGILSVRVFLNYADLYRNNAIATHLVNESTLQMQYLISGTIYDHEAFGVAEFKRLMSQCLFKTSHDLIERIIENEYIIYDISQDVSEVAEAEKVLEGLEKYYENNTNIELPIKYFILISTPLTWANTESRNGDSLLFETEYRRRRCHPSYVKHKHIERLVNMFEKKMEGKVRTVVLCPGHTFGGVNDIFHYIFKLAFFNKQKVPIVEPGHQCIPLIYIIDFAKIVVKIIKDFPPPETRYIIAVQPNFWTIKAFTRAIAESISGNVIRVAIMPKNCLVKYPDEMFSKITIDAITNPMKLIPNYLKDFEYTFTRPEEIGKQLAVEYRNERNLLPIKILIDGPPLSGKTTLAKDLAEYYNLNYIDPSAIVPLVMKRLQKDVNAGDKLLFNLEREKIEMGNEEDREIKEIEETVRELVNTWQEELLDITNHIIDTQKDAEDIVNYKIKCIKYILNLNLYCENQGYVIDGFPFNYEQAADIFFEGTEGLDDLEEFETESLINVNITENSFQKGRVSRTLPNFILLLDAPDELIWQRGMQLSLEESLRTGNNEEGVCKRLEEFRKRDEHEDTNLINFFYDINSKPICFTIAHDTKFQFMFEMFKEKIGPPHTYPLTPFEKIQLKNAEIERALRAEKEMHRRQKEIENKIRIEREAKLRKWSNEFESLKREEELAAEASTLPLRQYLSKFVLPTLTEGILEVSRVKPDDPVDYLAEFLFKNNLTGRILSDDHSEEMKKLLLDEGKESVLSILDNYVVNENELKCTDFIDDPSTSKK